MKNTSRKICAIMFTILLSILMTACGNGGGDGSKISVNNYLEKMEVRQVSIETGTSNGETITKQANLIAAEQVDDLVFLEFYLGEIRECFIQSLTTPVYNDGGVKTIKYTTSTSTTKTVSEGLSKTISTTDFVSVSNSQSKTVSWKLGASMSTTASASVGVNVGVVSAEAGVSQTFSLAAEVGKTTTGSVSKTVSEEITEQINETYNISEVIENKRETTYEYDLTDYVQGYYYALSLVGDIDVYQIITYDVKEEAFYTTYFISNINDSNTAIRLLKSDNLSFTITPEHQISPITEIDLEEILSCVNSELENAESAKGDTKHFAGGHGTLESPYLITTPAHFMNIALYPESYYSLLSDIDMKNTSYLPISNFGGCLMGNGYTISNLNIRADAYSKSLYLGLIKNNSGIITKLNIDSVNLAASPKFNNQDIDIYCGTIAALNKGTIKDCSVTNTSLVVNSSDIADKFISQYNEDPREILCGSAHWKAWISQSFDIKTTKWSDELEMRLYVGGIVGYNTGNIEDSEFIGSAEANLYDMLAKYDDKEHICVVGGIAGYNSGKIAGVNTVATVKAWIELDNDARGRGWIGSTAPLGVCFACGVAGINDDGEVSGQVNGEQTAQYRIYVPKNALFAANYNSKTKGKTTNLTIGNIESCGTK